MSTRREFLADTSLRQVDAVGLVVLSLIVGAGYFLGVRPVLNQMEAQRVLAVEIEEESSRAAELTRQVGGLTGELEQARRQLENGVPQLEPMQSLNHRLAELATLATDSGLRIDGIQPGRVSSTPFFDTVELRITGRGTYQDCTRFLSRLHGERRDMTVTTISLAGQPGGEDPRGTFTFTLSWHTASATSLAQHD